MEESVPPGGCRGRKGKGKIRDGDGTGEDGTQMEREGEEGEKKCEKRQQGTSQRGRCAALSHVVSDKEHYNTKLDDESGFPILNCTVRSRIILIIKNFNGVRTSAVINRQEIQR